MWYALAQPTNEKINVSHLSANNVAQLLTAAGYKLTDTTYGLATDTVSGLIKTGYTENGKNYAVKLDTAGAAYVTVNWQDKFDTYFGIDEDGNIYVKDNRGLWSNSFLSARGSDPEAGSGGGAGVDMESVWHALAQPTTEKINVSHIPALQQLSGQITNAQLANSSLSVAGVSVALGGSVSAEQIATALGLGSNAYTSTAYLPLTGGTMSGALSVNSYIYSPKGLFGLTEEQADSYAGKAYYNLAVGQKSPSMGASLLLYRDSTSYQSYIVWSTETQDHIGIGLAADANDLIIENHKAGIQIKGTGNLTYNTYPLLHSGNYTNYTVTKTGGGASGTWPISVSGTAADASKLGGIYSAEYMSHFRQSGVNIDTYATRSPKIIEVSEAAGTKPVSTLWLQVMQWGSDDPDYGFQMAHQYSSYGNLYFRQKASGAWGGWRTLLDTRNYASYLDSRYVEKSGDTMNGTLTLLCGGNNYDQGIRINRPTLADWATLTIGCVGSGTSGTSANTWLIGTPANSNSLIFCLNDSSDQKGLCLRDMTNTGLRWNGYGVWHAGLQGSGSGLDADLLDGYQSTSFQFAVSHNYELSLSGGTRGKYVILLHPDTLSSANNSLPVGYSVQGTFHLFRPLGNGTASIIVKSGAGYSSTWNSGSIIAMPDYNCFTSMKLVTCNYGGKLYRALFVDATQDIVNLYFRGVVMNRDTNFGLAVKYYDYGTGAVTNSEVNGSIADFQRYRAILFPQLIEGTITSAQKLATARLLWGRSFDGSGDIRGNIIVGDAIIHGSVTSNNTRFISSDNASNIYFSVGGLVDLVAEPSCLRRGASNTSETLGTSTYRWANVYAVNGDYSGNMTVSGWINNALILSQKGVSADNSDTTTFRINGHVLEFGGRGYAHQNYYFRPQYSASGETYAGMYIQNASAADSPVFYTTHYFTHNGHAYHSGHVGIGMAPTGNRLDVNGTIHSTTGIWSDGYISAKGQDTTSDARYKRDIAALPAQAALAVLMRLRPSTWAWKDDGRRGAGFIAQEVLGVLPEAVREVGGGEDRHLALNYQMLHAYEVSALQTHETELERLRDRVLLLENEIKRIRHGS